MKYDFYDDNIIIKVICRKINMKIARKRARIPKNGQSIELIASIGQRQASSIRQISVFFKRFKGCQAMK